MAKRIQVVLNRDVLKLGKTGDLVEVAPGYARNFLYPQGIAAKATPGILRQIEQRRVKQQERLAEERRQAEALKVALETIGRFTVQKQVGEGESIFGTVTDRDVAAAIKEASNQEVDRHGINLPEIHSLGFYKVQVKLHAGVEAEVEVHVAPL